MKKLAFAVAAACAAAIAVPAHASYVINIGQSGTDVVATGSGSIDFLDLTFQSFDFSPSQVDAASGLLFLDGSAGYGDIYAGTTGPTSFGSGGTFLASSTVGGNLASIGVDGANEIIIPGGYFAGSPMDPVTATWSNTTVNALGLSNGSYTWTWGSGTDADSLTINITGGSSGTPEPSTWALMILGVGMAGAAMRRRGGVAASA